MENLEGHGGWFLNWKDCHVKEKLLLGVTFWVNSGRDFQKILALQKWIGMMLDLRFEKV